MEEGSGVGRLVSFSDAGFTIAIPLVALDVYLSHMIVTSLSLGLLWWYVVDDRKLVAPDLGPVVVGYNTAGSSASAGFSALVLFLVRPVAGWYARCQTG